jgi:hypothetical protein
MDEAIVETAAHEIAERTKVGRCRLTYQTQVESAWMYPLETNT